MFRSVPALAAALVMAGSVGSATVPALSAEWPEKPVTIIVPYPAGGATDVVVRMIAEKLSDAFGQRVLVDNRGGGGGRIGTDFAAKSAPDGYTFLLGAGGGMITGEFMQANIGQKLPYDPAKDFRNVAMIARNGHVLVVNKTLDVSSLKEFVDHAKANPGQITVANSGVGTTTHLATELFRIDAGIDILPVIYAGNGPATTDLMAGVVQAQFDNPITAAPNIESGTTRAIAVTGDTRAKMLPDVPTFKESGYPDYSVYNTWFLTAPAATPDEIVTRMNAAINEALALPDLQEKLENFGYEIVRMSPAETDGIVTEERAKWGKLITDLKIGAAQ